MTDYDLARLQALYDEAKDEPSSYVIIYNGQEFVKGYLKYVLEYHNEKDKARTTG